MRCPGGTSGHGLDKVGRDTPANIQLLARGTNPQGCGAALAVYETDSGAAVFSVDSPCLAMSLLIDPGTSGMTPNVLRRFLAPRAAAW